MAVTNGYATLAQLREHLGDAAATVSTEGLERALNATSRAIDKHCGRRFWIDATVKVRTYRPEEGDLAWIHDIGTTAGLVIKTDTAGDGTYATTWAATDYELGPDPEAAVDEDAYAFWRVHAVDRYLFPLTGRARPVQVTAKFGWSAVPVDVEQACLIRAAAIFDRRESVNGTKGFDQFGVVRISRKRDPDVCELLDNFIKIGVGAV